MTEDEDHIVDPANLKELSFGEPEMSLTEEGLFTFTVQCENLPPIGPEKQALIVLAVMPRILHDMRTEIEDDLNFHIKDPFGALEGDDHSGPEGKAH
jgi:hypothetical protein